MAVKLIIGENNLGTVHPWIIDWLKDKEDANRYSKGSKKKIWVKCPICGAEKEVSICNAVRKDKPLRCSVCSDGISYPNKFGRVFLQQLPIQNLKFEYQDTWSNGAIYDDYFEYNNQKYLVEFDGAQHLNSNQNRDNYLFKLVHSDEEKNLLAKQNNFILIRIDCKYSTLEWIKEQIENSLFNQLFDLSNIDWIKCGKLAANSKLIEVCQYFNEHPNLSVSQIGKEMNLASCTISRYLKKGTELKLCNYNTEIAEKNRTEQVKNTNRNKLTTLIYAYDKNNTLIGTYLSQTHAAEELNKLYPDKNFTSGGIGKVCRGELHKHKDFYFERKEKQ